MRVDGSSADTEEDHDHKTEWNEAGNTAIFLPLAEKAY